MNKELTVEMIEDAEYLLIDPEELVLCMALLNLDKENKKHIWEIINSFKGKIENSYDAKKQKIIIYDEGSNILIRYCSETDEFYDDKGKVIALAKETEDILFRFEIVDNNKKLLGKISCDGELLDENDKSMNIFASYGTVYNEKEDIHVKLSIINNKI